MKKILFHLTPLILILCLVAFTGCIKAPTVPPIGGTFSQISSPYSGDLNKPIGSECGEASCKSVLFYLFAFGDCSVDAAARNGDLEEVNYIGYNYTNIISIYTDMETKACGE